MSYSQKISLICAYHFHQLLPAIIAVNYHREIKKIGASKPVLIYVPDISSAEENLILASFPECQFINNHTILLKIALLNFMLIKIGAKILQKMYGENFFEVIYFPHDATSDGVAQTFMQAFPKAERVCYGDAWGNLIDRNYFENFFDKNSKTPGHFFSYLKRKIKPWGCHWLTMQSAVLTVPIDFSGNTPENFLFSIPPKKYAKNILHKAQQNNTEYNHYMHKLVSQSEEPKYLLLLTNLAESGLMTARNEDVFFKNIIEKYIPKKAILILKPHAGSYFEAVKKLVDWCEQKGYITHVFSKEFWKMPIELSEELVKKSQVLSISYASISLSYFFDVSVIHVLENDFIEKYFFSDKKYWVSHHNQIYMMAKENLKHWDGKDFLYKPEKKLDIYLVGGAVRDQLLGLPVKEKDWVVVGSTPEEMLALGFRQVGKDFPVFLHPETHEEYALARTERKTGRGYTQFVCYAAPDVPLEEDLKRRDLTINAIAKKPNGDLIDPYDGQKDLANKLLRHVSEAFVEDPVRILRTARFAARFSYLGFTVADETMILLSQMVQNGEVNALVAERVWQELSLALQEKNPEVFFTLLRNCGALKIIFPELDQLFGVPNPVKWHPEVDTGIHTLLVLQAACRLSQEPEVRFAALVHDLGKGVTPQNKWPQHIGHEKAGVVLIKALCARYKVPKNYTNLALLVARYHGLCHKALILKPTTLVKFLRKMDAFRKPRQFEQFLTACEADCQGRSGYEEQRYPQAHFLKQLLIAIKKVDIKPLVERGLPPEELKMAIYKAQVGAAKKFMGIYGL